MILLWFFAKIAKNGSARLNKMAARAKNKKKSLNNISAASGLI